MFNQQGVGAGSLATLTSSEVESIDIPKNNSGYGVLTPSNLMNELYKRVELNALEKSKSKDEIE
jgi:hypothetical protein